MASGTATRGTDTSATSGTDVREAARAGSAKPPQRQSWWRRLWARAVDSGSTQELQAARLERLLALLEDARGELDAGWVQGGWWSVATPDGGQHIAGGLAAATVPPEQVEGSCLVGALVLAGRRQAVGADSEVGTAVDMVYDALWEARGTPSPTGLPTLTAPWVRLTRVQTLTKWNDQAERTQQQVLQVVDRAISRTMQSIVALPGPQAQAPVPVGQ